MKENINPNLRLTLTHGPDAYVSCTRTQTNLTTIISWQRRASKLSGYDCLLSAVFLLNIIPIWISLVSLRASSEFSFLFFPSFFSYSYVGLLLPLCCCKVSSLSADEGNEPKRKMSLWSFKGHTHKVWSEQVGKGGKVERKEASKLGSRVGRWRRFGRETTSLACQELLSLSASFLAKINRRPIFVSFVHPNFLCRPQKKRERLHGEEVWLAGVRRLMTAENWISRPQSDGKMEPVFFFFWSGDRTFFF